MSQQPSDDIQPIEQAAASDESIQDVHARLLAERKEPSSGYSPMPLFLLGFISAMILICAIYLVHFRGGFDAMVYDERFDPKTAAGAGGPVELTPEQIIAQGKKLYATCATCHQPNGQGLPGVYPPLVGSEWVVGNEERVVRILLDGLTGPIEVEGNTYNGAMPAFGAAGYKWSDDKIAAVLTYVRQEWGNAAEPVTAARVKEIRAADNRGKPWTGPELQSYE